MALDRRDMRPGQLAGREAAGAQAVARGLEGEPGELRSFDHLRHDEVAVMGAWARWRRMSPGRSPSVTTSSRQRALIGITERIGSTPSVSTSPNCSIQPRICDSSPASRSCWASGTSIRASTAMRATVALSSDMRDNPCIGKRRPTGPARNGARKLHALSLVTTPPTSAHCCRHAAQLLALDRPSAASASPAPTRSAASARSRSMTTPPSGRDGEARRARGQARAPGGRAGHRPADQHGRQRGPMAKAMRAEAARLPTRSWACRRCCRTSGSRPSPSRMRSPRAGCPGPRKGQAGRPLCRPVILEEALRLLHQ